MQHRLARQVAAQDNLRTMVARPAVLSTKPNQAGDEKQHERELRKIRLFQKASQLSDWLPRVPRHSLHNIHPCAFGSFQLSDQADPGFFPVPLSLVRRPADAPRRDQCECARDHAGQGHFVDSCWRFSPSGVTGGRVAVGRKTTPGIVGADGSVVRLDIGTVVAQG